MVKNIRRKSFSDMIEKLYLRWRDGQQLTVLMYSACNTVGFSDFLNIEQVKSYVMKAPIDMIYIKTPQNERQIYLDNFDTYNFELNALNITFFNGSKEHIRF